MHNFYDDDDGHNDDDDDEECVITHPWFHWAQTVLPPFLKTNLSEANLVAMITFYFFIYNRF